MKIFAKHCFNGIVWLCLGGPIHFGIWFMANAMYYDSINYKKWGKPLSPP